MKTQHHLALCADDYGAAAHVDAAIDRLAHAGRLAAASMLVLRSRWPEAARRSHLWPATVKRGLHFNLSDGFALSSELRRHWDVLPRLPALIALAHAHALPLAAIGAELEAQIDRFQVYVGAAPAFVDGHQHVHHLPGVRDLVLRTAHARGLAVRNTGRVEGPSAALKRRLIEFSGGRALQRELRRLHIPHNDLLLGAYDFEADDYRARMQGWLATLDGEDDSASALLFCHPGDSAARSSGDEIAAAREREAHYLESPAFSEDLAAAGVALGPAFAAARQAGGQSSSAG
ncbi:ChbG/HpnK family deacetylase [Rubrivivax gelatinosus]|uniref:ChbG/HpnK family deacetylase n=1 Tax=Rubrivivax gelatinosus TaxID=28068 RepID=A0ABS1E0H0_RUBGE|nr:ChbG/HpnK family deacetylase [Rubrivivax gelatinosus]MBK1714435.1 hypothetical protein [Rubrivivax gelatinosus]